MSQSLPKLERSSLRLTRDYLRDVALALGSFQRAFLPKDPHDWHYGLEVGMRGFGTRAVTVAGQEVRASLDLVRHKVRLGGSKWPLTEYAAPGIFKNVKAWLAAQDVSATLEEPEFSTASPRFDPKQADAYAAVLWWMDEQFRGVKAGLSSGLASPILLYPHHFDLAVTWFPWNDERQVTIGFSTGDPTIAEPYVYLTAYPEPKGLSELKLPAGAHWQAEGFRGAILPYAALQDSRQPEELLEKFITPALAAARQLFS